VSLDADITDMEHVS